MAAQIYTYHCICTHLLFASTHIFSSLPRRSHERGSIDAALILPLPKVPLNSKNLRYDLPPPEGYTLLLGIEKDSKIHTIRKSDGFERRILYQCSRCKVVIGYEILPESGVAELDTTNRIHAEEDEDKSVGSVNIMYILPGGLMTTEFMASKEKIMEEEVELGNEISVFMRT
ncbi:hypothetical protein OnM2_093009 [Erysiphe neolycopersici]|uniref:STEEP1 domain-containing protein n=1 Tax=Erysiphe neolycopersici TaxID=212602 RepID=A0A420HBX3_9PEZI|nr:hypothetical protein OnM2_093009 [Erysiphe neolycopersici]